MENIESSLKDLKDIGLVEFTLSYDRRQLLIGEPGCMSSLSFTKAQTSKLIAELIVLRNFMDS